MFLRLFNIYLYEALLLLVTMSEMSKLNHTFLINIVVRGFVVQDCYIEMYFKFFVVSTCLRGKDIKNTSEYNTIQYNTVINYCMTSMQNHIMELTPV